MSRVIVLGSVNEDLRVPVERHPRPGETLLGGDLERRFGGKGGNQAVAAALAGAETVLIGAVGDDAPGHAYLDRLAAYGVDTSRMLVRADAPTGTALIVVDASGENTIVVAPGANARLTVADLSALDDVGAGDVLLMPLEGDLDVIAEAARRASAAGARVVLNLAPFAELPADVLAVADPVIVNEHEREQLRATGAEPASVLTTLGPAGSEWGDERLPGLTVAVVDTTGAGDAYCGTLAAALLRGDDRAAAMRAATAASATAVTYDGAQPPLD